LDKLTLENYADRFKKDGWNEGKYAKLHEFLVAGERISCGHFGDQEAKLDVLLHRFMQEYIRHPNTIFPYFPGNRGLIHFQDFGRFSLIAIFTH